MENQRLSRPKFDKQMEGMNLYDANGEGVRLLDLIYNSVTQLLAWERHRCATVLGKAAEVAFREAEILRHHNLAYQHRADRGDALEFAEQLILEMGDD